MKILCADDEELLLKIISLELEANLDCELVLVGNGKDAIEKLSSGEEFDLVISDYNMPHCTGGDVYKYIRENRPHIPFILLSGQPISVSPVFATLKEDHKSNHYFPKPYRMDDVIEYIKSILAVPKPKITPKYCRIKTKTFFLFDEVPIEIFIRLTTDRYIKIVSANDHYEEAFINKYLDKDIQFLYIRYEDLQSLLDQVSLALKSNLDSKQENKSAQINSKIQGTALLHDIVRAMGVTTKVIEVADSINESNFQLLKSNASLAKLVNDMKQAGDYRFTFCLMVSYLGIGILNELDWSSEVMFKKISLAALFQNITLDEEELVRVQAVTEDAKKLLGYVRFEMVKAHPEKSAQLVSKTESISSEVEDIIRCHHEKPDGSGFPRGLSALNLSPLSCIFILAHEVSHRFHDLEVTDARLAETLTDMRQEYSQGNFLKPFQGLEKIFKNAV